MPVWAADFMAGVVDVSRSRALRQARLFGLIVALRGTYRDHVRAMKAVNPDLTLLVYLNGAMAQADQGEAYPQDWYARDRRGRKVRSLGFGNYLMRPDEPGWIADVIGRCRSYLASSGYDGCFLDVLGTAPINASYVTSPPVDPRTGKAWTAEGWLVAMERIASATRRAVAPAPVLGNGLGDGLRYFSGAPSARLLRGLDGAMAEMFVRDPAQPVRQVNGGRLWRMDVRMLADAASRGRTALSMTKVWTATTPRATAAVHRYALGTFLLGYRPGRGFFSFRDDRDLTRYRPIWSTELGAPLGPAERRGRVFVRTFEHGLVVVNPNRSTITVPLGRSLLRRDGTQVSTVVLRGHRAAILSTGA